MNLSDNASRLCDAIYEYIESIQPTETKGAELIDIREFETCRTLSLEEQESILNELKTLDPPLRIVYSGHNCHGFHFRLNLDTWKLVSHPIHFATVLFTSEKNRPKAVVMFDNDVEEVRYENNTYHKCGSSPIGWNVKAHKVDDVLYPCEYCRRPVPEEMGEWHKVSKSGVVVHPDSIREFYFAGGMLYTKLTKSAIMRAVNRCENIYRYEPNFKGTANWAGLTFVVWQTTLLDFSSFPAAVDEDIRSDEIDILAKCLGYNHVIVREALRRYGAERMNVDEKDDIKRRVSKKVAALQDVVDNNKSKILEYAIVHTCFRKEAYEQLVNTANTRHRYSGYPGEVLAFRNATSVAVRDIVWSQQKWKDEHCCMDMYAELLSRLDAEIDSDSFGSFASEVIRCIVPKAFNPMFECPIIGKAANGFEINADVLANSIGLYLAARALSIEEKVQFLRDQDPTFGFDCGFIYFSFKDPILDNDLRNAANFGLEKAYGNGDFSLELPVFVQSTSIKRYMGEKIVELCKAAGLPAISYNTKLD